MAVMALNFRFPLTAAPTTPPSAGVMKRHNLVVVDVACANPGTQDATPIVHNMDLAAFLATDGRPEIGFAYLAASVAGAFQSGPQFAITDKDTITVTPANVGAGDDFTVRVWIRRPHSLNR